MAEIDNSAYSQPLPEFLRNGGPLVVLCSWKAPVENHAALEEHVRTNMDYQRLSPSTSFYSRTRHWYRLLEDGKTEEWFFMDEYDSAEAFGYMQRYTQSMFTGEASDSVSEHYQRWIDLLDPSSHVDLTLYSEVDGGRVEFEPFAQRSRALDEARTPWWDAEKK